MYISLWLFFLRRRRGVGPCARQQLVTSYCPLKYKYAGAILIKCGGCGSFVDEVPRTSAVSVVTQASTTAECQKQPTPVQLHGREAKRLVVAPCGAVSVHMFGVIATHYEYFFFSCFSIFTETSKRRTLCSGKIHQAPVTLLL